MFKGITLLTSALTKLSFILTLLVGVSLTSVHAESRRKTVEVMKESQQLQDRKDAQEIIPIVFNSVEPFSEGFAKVRLNGKIGFINKKGKWVIKPQFADAESFSEGLAAVELNGKYGFINKQGHMVIKPQFMHKPGDWGRGHPPVKSFSDGLARVKADNGKWGYINKKGQMVIQPQFDYTYNQDGSFSEGFAKVRLNGKEGFINKEGKIVIEPRFDRSDSFSEGLAAVEVNGQIGFINKKGKTVITPQFYKPFDLWSVSFSEGLAAVLFDGGYGFINKKGETVIKPQFDLWTKSFSEGLARVRLNRKFGYINKKGEMVIQPQFNKASSFSEGLAAVEVNGQIGFINKKGKIVIKPQFQLIDPRARPYSDFGNIFSNGFALVRINEAQKKYDSNAQETSRYLEEEWGYINKQGKVVIRFNLEFPAFPPEHGE